MNKKTITVSKVVIVTIKILVILLFLFIVIYISSPLYLSYLEKKINKVENKPPYEVAENIKKFHNSLFIVDLHADSLFSYRDLLKKNSYGHVDIPRLIEGNVALQVFGVPSIIDLSARVEGNNDGKRDILGVLAFLQHWPPKTWWNPQERIIYQVNKIHKFVEKSKGTFEIIKTSRQLESYFERHKRETGITAGILALEGVHVLDADTMDIDILYNKGFRIIGLTHFIDNNLGGSAHGVKKDGLTEFGKRAVKRMEELNMIIDLTHASSNLINDVLDVSSGSVIVSHTGVKGCVDNNRNLTDEQIKRIADKGGLIGIGFWDTAVGNTDGKAIADSILYVVNLVGVEHVALGSDFDGGVVVPFDTTGVIKITEALLQIGMSEEEIRGVMGENALRFLLKALPKD